MTQPSNPRAGGAILALSTVVGAGVGMAWGEASAGVIAGVAAGVIVCLWLWWADHRRGRR